MVEREVARLCACCALFLVLMFPAPVPAATNWQALPVAATHKLVATEPGVFEAFPTTLVRLRSARGEWECFQIAVTAGDQELRALTATAGTLVSQAGNGIDSTNIQLYWQHHVLVDKPSGNRRLARLWWPDALIPLTIQPERQVSPHRSVALWCALFVPTSGAAGNYRGQIAISCDAGRSEIPIELTVEPVVMPAATMKANVAIYYDALRDWYSKSGRSFDDARWAPIKRAYYDFLLDYRINAYDLPVPWQSEYAKKYLLDPRVTSVRLPALNSPELKPAVDLLRSTNTIHKAYYYYIDEPGPDRATEIRETTARLRELEPRLRHCVTVHPQFELEGSVDIWCPNIGDFFGPGCIDWRHMESERKKGRETWWYTMVEPKYPYPTWLLDDDSDSVRAYGWMMANSGVTGFVYSMAHGWGPNPLESLRSFADTNGDGTLLYPSEIVSPQLLRPLPSIRLMLLRDAIEDYELLKLAPDRVRRTISTPFGPPFLRSASDPIDWDSLRLTLFRLLTKSSKRVPIPAVPAFDKTSERGITFDRKLGTGVLPSLSDEPKIDGDLSDKAWIESALLRDSFRRFEGDTEAIPPQTRLWVRASRDMLWIAFHAELKQAAPPDSLTNFDSQATRGEWVAVDLAPSDASERWRFIVTPAGRAIIERHTRRGHYRIEELVWRHAVKSERDSYMAEMAIPLEVIGNPRRFRFNALRRVNDPQASLHYVVRAVPDANSAALMPRVRF